MIDGLLLKSSPLSFVSTSRFRLAGRSRQKRHSSAIWASRETMDLISSGPRRPSRAEIISLFSGNQNVVRKFTVGELFEAIRNGECQEWRRSPAVFPIAVYTSLLGCWLTEPNKREKVGVSITRT
jgi:hypothetical protein